PLHPPRSPARCGRRPPPPACRPRAICHNSARLMSLHLGLLLGYSALLVGLGLWIGRRVSGTKDFFVGARRLGPGLIFSTMLAANIGGGSTVGATGLGYRDGLSA